MSIKVSMHLYEVRLSVNGSCNHNCIYCGPFSDGKKDLGYEKLNLKQVELLPSLLKQYNLHVQITGGEPTLHRDLIDIVKILRRDGLEDIGMSTNGSRLSPNYASSLINAGISDIHIHLPSLDREVYLKTTRPKNKKENLEEIINTTFFLKSKNTRVEFNTPVTKINLPTLPKLLSFCYENEINLKLIEEVNILKENIKLEDITTFLEKWFEKEKVKTIKKNVKNTYGKVYSINDNFYFRIAPATEGLVDYLNKKSKRILYDGRYWIGGKNNLFLFTPSYFLKPIQGTFNDLKKNLIKTKRIYDGYAKK